MIRINRGAITEAQQQALQEIGFTTDAYILMIETLAEEGYVQKQVETTGTTYTLTELGNDVLKEGLSEEWDRKMEEVISETLKEEMERVKALRFLAQHGGMIVEIGGGEARRPDLDKIVHKWWETVVLDATGEYVWDEEVKAVNSMMDKIDEFPEWALQIRDVMPRYGFEMCSHRWLEGVDHVIGMVGAEKFHPSNAGHCGDVPSRIIQAAERRATAVQSWIEGRVSPKDEFDMQVADWLAELTARKKEAAHCYVELIRAHFLKPDDHAQTMSKQWRTRASKNEILKLMFEGEGFDSLLRARCGFKIIDRLDLYIRIIGGNHSQLADRHGVCNDQLRFIPKDDTRRLETTVGYLWGLYAYLLGKDEAWLLESNPERAGAAIYALRRVSRAGKPTPLRRWLTASLLKSTKLWCQCALNNMPGAVPACAQELPDVVAAIKG